MKKENKQKKSSGQPSVPTPGSVVEAFSKMGEQERSRLKIKWYIL